jgi:hypothetical protein
VTPRPGIAARLVAGVEPGACGGGVVGAFEGVGVDLEGDVGIGMSELAADEDEVEPARDEERGEVVSERVEGVSRPEG